MSDKAFDTNLNNTRLTGASTPVIFSDGFELYLSPLSDKDITELDNWLKERYLYLQRKGVPEDADEDTKDRIERIAQQTAATLTWYLGIGAGMMACLDGLCRILYQASKKNHPDITYDIIHEKLLLQSDSEKFANDAVEDVLNKSYPEAKVNTGGKTDKANPTVKNIPKRKNTSTKRRSTAN